MSNAVFPVLPGLKWGVVRHPSFSTTKKKAVNGREYRAANMIYPEYVYKLSYEFLRDLRSGVDELRTLEGFFLQRYGSFDSFLWTDPDDNSATAQQIGTGDGTTTAFQLVRSWGGFTMPVYDVNGAPQIYKAGVLQTVTTHYTLGSTGVVTFVTAPSAGQAITWTGSYYKRVRFELDYTEFEKFMAQLWSAKSVDLRSDKP